MSRTTTGESGTSARGLVNGTVSNGSTWYEDLEITEAGTVVADADDWDWRFTFRRSYSVAVDLTLSTDETTLAIVQTADATTLQIRVPYTDLTSMEGDYIADLASKDTAGRVIHWLHGVVTFRDEPIWSD